jgi:hypothetical protein
VVTNSTQVVEKKPAPFRAPRNQRARPAGPAHSGQTLMRFQVSGFWSVLAAEGWPSRPAVGRGELGACMGGLRGRFLDTEDIPKIYYAQYSALTG